MQLDFGGFGSSELTDSLFLAIFPDPAAAACIAGLTQSLRREHGLRGQALLAGCVQ